MRTEADKAELKAIILAAVTVIVLAVFMLLFVYMIKRPTTSVGPPAAPTGLRIVQSEELTDADKELLRKEVKRMIKEVDDVR